MIYAPLAPQLTLNRYSIHISADSRLSTNYQPTVDQVSMECRLRIDHNVLQVLIEMSIEGIDWQLTEDAFGIHDPDLPFDFHMARKMSHLCEKTSIHYNTCILLNVSGAVNGYFRISNAWCQCYRYGTCTYTFSFFCKLSYNM